MNEETVSRTTEAFEDDPAFRRADGEQEGFAATTTPFEATVRLDGADGGRATVRVTVRAPTLDAVVADETVAPVVEDGWFETLELRLADAHTVTTDDAEPPTVERGEESVTVSLSFGTRDPDRATEDARAVVEYVEGTWMQGVIPGYEYGEPAAGMLERAEQNYDA